MLTAIVLIVVVFCLFAAVCAGLRAMSDGELFATITAVIVAVVGGIGYAFGGARGCFLAIGLLLALCAIVIVKWVFEGLAKRRRDEAARAKAERIAHRQQQDLTRVQSAYPTYWTAQRVWSRPGWLDAKGWQPEERRLSDLLGPSEIIVTREFDDDLHLFSAVRVRNTEATDTYLADVRRGRADELRGKRQSVQHERRRQEMERAVKEAKDRAREDRIAQQIVLALDDLPQKLE